MKEILRLQNVKHQYNEQTVLDIPLLSIYGGSIIGLAGPNGSGKSTMLKILSLVEECSSGAVFFQNKKVKPFAKEGRHLLTYLPQETYLLKRSVFDNISYGLLIRGAKNNLGTAVYQVLELVGLPSSFAKRQWDELSGGEAQRVALAARLVFRPACLMLDEPIASVDMESARNIRRAIISAREEWGTTLVITSHHQAWLNDICDKIIYLYNGCLLECSYKNVLLGPWEKLNNELSGMKMTNGQLLYGCNPPGPEGSGVLAPHLIRISSSLPSGDEKMISGLITGVFADKDPGTLCVDVVCGEQQFVISIPENEFLQERILPNQHVSMLYHPKDIVWLS